MEFMMIRMAKEVESIFAKSKRFQGLMTKPLVKVDDFVLLKFYTIAFAVCVPQLRQVVEKLELLIAHTAEASKKPHRIIWIKIRRLGRVDLLLDAVTWSAI
ncbi:hypothetical protein pipiens_013229 [Culex pipiens pipiens]|uniref:Uncharacterized protein n=1 Tax=Culex pipiens pipiens TaxID=38569 RepID=A0ABD1CZC5_CULPP